MAVPNDVSFSTFLVRFLPKLRPVVFHRPFFCPRHYRGGTGGAGMTIKELDTTRLRLRAWREADLAPFAALNADPAVMEFMPGLLSRADSDAMAGRICTRFAEQGWVYGPSASSRVTPSLALSVFPNRASKHPSRPASRSVGVSPAPSGAEAMPAKGPARRSTSPSTR